VNRWASVELVAEFRIRNHPVGIEGVGNINSHIWSLRRDAVSWKVRSPAFSIEGAVSHDGSEFPLIEYALALM